MAETTKISVYRILECGYFRQKTTDPAISDVASMFEDLAGWLENKQIRDTATFGSETDAFRTLGLCPVVKSDTYLLSLFNVTAANGQQGFIDPTSSTAAPGITAQDTTKVGLPGFATYFWVVPARSAFVVVRRLGNPSGLGAFRKYVRGFVKWQSRHAVKEVVDNDNTVVLGYSETGQKPVQPGLYPRFKDRLVVDPALADLLRQNREEIVSVSGSEQLHRSRMLDRTLWKRMMGWVAGDGTKVEEVPSMTSTVKFNFEAPYTPSAEELEFLLTSPDFANGGGAFGLKDGRKIHVDKSILRHTINLGTGVGSGLLWNGEALITALVQRENQIFKGVDP